MAWSKEAKVEFLHRFDSITEALATLDSDTLEGYDSQALLTKLIDLYNATAPFAQAMRPKPLPRIRKGELSPLQKAVLNRFRETGTVRIYEGYRKFIRTANSLDNKGLIKRNRDVHGDHWQYDLAEEGRKALGIHA